MSESKIDHIHNKRIWKSQTFCTYREQTFKKKKLIKNTGL